MKKGKNLGSIDIQVKMERSCLVFQVSDDGRGLNLARLKEVQNTSQLNYKLAENLVFASGVSTAENLSDVSGRGIGMGAVKSFIESAGGEIRLDLGDEKRRICTNFL